MRLLSNSFGLYACLLIVILCRDATRFEWVIAIIQSLCGKASTPVSGGQSTPASSAAASAFEVVR